MRTLLGGRRETAKPNRRTFGKTAAAFVLLATALSAAGGRAETKLIPARALRAAGASFEIPAAGDYTVWVWSRCGESVEVAVDGRRIGKATPLGESGKFAWAKVGEIALESGGKHKIALRAGDAPTEKVLAEKVGFVLFSTDKKARPGRFFELARLRPYSPEAVADRRVTEFRHNKKTYTLRRYRSKEEWLRHAEFVRKQILVATGLWPLPERTPLNVHRFGRLDRDGYSIEKVYFESYPGFFVTGNLYLPRGRKPPYPAMLCPHGHGREGRLTHEKRFSVPARCITFARLGCVVFAPDMVGYNDSNQLKHHFSYPLWGLSLMGLQLWDNIRALDFLQSVEGVDRRRIGCTGASGGGTQTFILTAVEDRVKVAVPVCMVSAHFQGGCECENPPLLRLNTNNVEIAAMGVPRPYMLAGATGDWTKNVMKVEGPFVRSIYKLFGVPDKFDYFIVDAGHNYNKETREHVYRWMGRWLLGETDLSKLHEKPFKVEKREDMLVFTKDHPRPARALDEKGLRDYLVAQARKQLESLRPKTPAALGRFREIYGTMLRHTLFAAEPEAADVRAEVVGRVEGPTWKAEKLVLGRKDTGESVPALLLLPSGGKPIAGAVIIVSPQGKAGVVDAETGEPSDLAAALLRRGRAVLAPDCFLTGEYHTPFAETKRALPDRFAYTYNPTTLAWRVQDILTARAYLAQREGLERVDLVGLGAAGPWCMLAAALGGPHRGRTVVDENRFADESESSWQGDMFQPNILRCGGLRVAGALTAPGALLVHNTGGALDTDWIAEAYRAAGAARAFESRRNRLSAGAIADWLCEKTGSTRR